MVYQWNGISDVRGWYPRPVKMERIIAAQRDLHGRIARTYENLKKSGSAKISLEIVQSMLGVLETRWAKFEAQQERLSGEFYDELKKHEYLTGDFMSEVEIVRSAEGETCRDRANADKACRR